MATQTIEISVVDKTQRALRGIQGRLTALNQGLLGVNRVAGLAATAVAAIGGANVIRNIINTSARFEDLRTSLSSVAGGAREGAEAFDFVAKFATKTQFGVEELTQTYIKLRAAGIEPTEKLLTTFTDTAAVTTDQIGSLQAITDLFARTTEGGLNLEELNRLGDRGIPIFRILKEQLNITKDEVAKFGKTAEGAEAIRSALQKGLDESFGGATAARVNNLSTRLSNLQIAITNAFDALGKAGLNEALGQLAVRITKLIEDNPQLVQEIGVKLTKAFLTVTAVGEFLLKNLGLLGNAMLVLLKIKLALFAIQAATAMAQLSVAMAGAAVAGAKTAKSLTKGLFSTLMAVTPQGRLARLAIAGLGAIGISFAFLGDESEDTEKKVEDSTDGMLEKLEKFAKGAMDALGVEGFDKLKQDLDDIERKAEELAKLGMRALEAPDIEVPTPGGDGKPKTDVFGAQKYEEFLKKVRERVALLNEEANGTKLSLALKEAELQIEGELTEEQRKQLTDQFNQIESLTKEIQLRQQLESKAEDLIAMTIAGHVKEQELLKKSSTLAYQLLDERKAKGELTEQQLADAKTDITLSTLEKLNNLEDEFLQRRERAEMDQIERVLEARLQGLDAYLSAEQKALLQRKGQEQKTKEIVNDRIEFEKKSELEKTEFGLEQGSKFFKGLAAYNKKFFAAYKAFAIAQAIINTYQGATKALATYPPPFNFIAAAATVASGLAQVATIRAQTAQRGGNLITGGPAVVGEDGPELIVPKQPSTVIPREVATALEGMGGRNQPVQVVFQIQANDTSGFDQLLTQRRGLIVNLINTALNERGKAGITA